MISILFVIAALSVFLYGTLRAISDFKMYVRMKKRESKLRRRGLTPYGSNLSHGMIYDKRIGSIRPTQTPSITWYRNLAR